MKRNEDKHTSREAAELNILVMMAGTSYTKGTTKSAMGYAAYHDYYFRMPQGAAFSVAKIARKMQDEGLIAWAHPTGYYITPTGKEYATRIVPPLVDDTV